jgi:N-acetylmuramoyl-L-alanine amidase
VWDLLYTEYRAESVDLARAICRGLSKSGAGSKNRGVKSARFAVLKGSRMPAILVEVGFLSNASEEQKLRSPSYRQRLAEGIRNGIRDWRI